MFSLKLLTGNTKQIPKQGLSSFIRSYDPVIKAFPDSVGASARPLQDLQYIQADGTGYFTHVLLTSAAVIVTKQGTSTPGFATAGRMTCTSGTLWSFTIRYVDLVECRYEFASKTGATSATVFDVSGNGRHLEAVGFTNVSAVCASGQLFGSDWLNINGFSRRENLISGADASTAAISVGLPDQEGWRAYTKLTSAVGGSAQIYISSKRQPLQKTMLSARLSVKAIPGAQNTSCDLGFYSAGWSGQGGVVISGPGSISVQGNGWITLGNLSTTEETVYEIYKNNCTIGSTISTLSLYAGTIASTNIGDGVYIRNISISDNWPVLESAIKYNVPYSYQPGTLLTYTALPKCVCVGDSMTSGYVPTLARTFPNSSFINAGVPGNSTTQMLDRFAGDVISVNPNACVILCGINDIVQGKTSAQITANLLSCYTSAAAAGITVFPVTIAPFGLSQYWTAGLQVILEEVNNFIRSYCVSNNCRCVDLYSYMLQPSTTRLNYNLASADYLHLNPYGSEGQGMLIASVINTSTGGSVDSIGNALQYPGRAKYNLIPKQGNCATFASGTSIAVTVPSGGYALTGGTIANEGTATVTLGTNTINHSVAGTLYNARITASGHVITFPLCEGSGTTVWGYDDEGRVYTGAITAADINAFWAGKQDMYFPGLQYGCSFGRWSPVDRTYKDEPSGRNLVLGEVVNPTGTQYIPLVGNATASISIVDDTANLAAAGLAHVCTSGKVYKVTNTAVGEVVTVYATVQALLPHALATVLSVYGRLEGPVSANNIINNTAPYTGVPFESGGPYKRYSVAGVSNVNTVINIRVAAGQTVYFTLPQIEDGSVLTSVVIGKNTLGSPKTSISGLISSNPITGLDCLGNPLQYKPKQLNPSAKYSFPWSNELVAADTTNKLFDAGGTPKALTFAEVMALQGNQIFASLTKGVAVYATPQVDPALTKIKKAMKLI